MYDFVYITLHNFTVSTQCCEKVTELEALLWLLTIIFGDVQTFAMGPRSYSDSAGWQNSTSQLPTYLPTYHSSPAYKHNSSSSGTRCLKTYMGTVVSLPLY